MQVFFSKSTQGKWEKEKEKENAQRVAARCASSLGTLRSRVRPCDSVSLAFSVSSMFRRRVLSREEWSIRGLMKGRERRPLVLMFERKEGAFEKRRTHFMPRSTSGMAVSIESELVTLPSSPTLRSTLYRGSSLSKTSSCAFPTLGRAVVLVLAPAAIVLAEPVLVPSFVSAGCRSRAWRSIIFSSMYAILRGISQFILPFKIERKRLHVLVDVERISLLRKVVRANSTTHLRGFVFWLPVTCPP
jgi:hypothetical protein